MRQDDFGDSLLVGEPQACESAAPNDVASVPGLDVGDPAGVRGAGDCAMRMLNELNDMAASDLVCLYSTPLSRSLHVLAAA